MIEHLSAIRAFESAGRHGNFTAAAVELGLTQSAVSRHVRTLEDHFGRKLFDRHGRRVALTEIGAIFHREVSEGLRLIRGASARLKSARSENRVTLSLLPSVAALWLAPRLSDFAGRHPRIELVIQASRTLVDLSAGEADLSIRYGTGRWAGTRSTFLCDETLFPVCSPEFKARHGLNGDVEALLQVPLLADDLVDGWGHWFALAGNACDPARVTQCFDDSASLYHAAAGGSGVALGRSFLVGQHLAERRLVAASDVEVAATYSYWIVQPDRGEPSPSVRQFVSWLKEQVHGDMRT